MPRVYWTVTVPVICGWIEQWYAYVPAFVNVCENDEPGASWPLSKLLSFAVTVCVTESLLVQVTLPPVLTVMLAGLKAKFAIVTALPPAAPPLVLAPPLLD
jgi:hypothetical protein